MEVEAEAARTQLERLVQSKTFETSEAQRRLLQYLADKCLSGEADRLKEYTIGLEAFGKPSTYDPKQDSIVRLQAGRLRQKLMAYYQSEAPDDPIRITLPKGGFKLSFELAHHGTALQEQPSAHFPRMLMAVLLATLLWAAIATGLLIRGRQGSVGRRWSADLETLWSPFLEGDRPVLVCLGTPMFVRFPNFGFFRDPRANEWVHIDRSERIEVARKAFGDKDLIAAYTFTGTGEASAAVLISQLLANRGGELLLTRSNILSWEQILDHNVVFLGPPKFNPQLEAHGLNQDIVVEPDGIRNLKPQPGEPAFLPDRVVAGKQSEGETHALISLTPGPSGMRELLVIAGNASADTFGAAEWLTQPWRAKELVRRLRLPSGEVPRYFQVVLKVEFRQGIPVQSSYVFHHVVSAPGTRPAK